MVFPEFTSSREIPYVRFPDKPETIKVGRFQVHEYIAPRDMRKYIVRLSDRVSLDRYEAVLVNLKGGMFLFNCLADLQGYKLGAVEIEYHRPEKGYGAIVKKPVPKEYRKSKVLVIDDIYDTGGVMKAIMDRVDPLSQAVALVTKNNIPNQIRVKNIEIGLRIDPVWVGGVGMDLSVPDEESTFRDYPGLVVKIPDRVST